MMAATWRSGVPAIWPDRVFGWLVISGTLAACISVLSVVVALLSAFAGRPFSMVWVALVFTATSILLAPLPLLTLPALRAEGRVLNARRAPAAVWRHRVARHNGMVGAALLVAALALVLLRLLATPAPSVVQALLPGALLCALGGAMVLLSAAAERLLPPLAGAGLLVALVVAVQHGGSFAALAWTTGAGAMPGQVSAGQALLVCVLGASLLPLSLAAVQRRLIGAVAAQPLAAGPGQAGPSWPRQLADTLRRHFERWRQIDGPAIGGLWVVVLSQLPSNIGTSMSKPDAGFLQPWDSTVTAMHGLRLLLLTALALAALRADGLHWRYLLAPTGRFRRTLGPRIVGSTLLFMALSMALVLCVLALLWMLLPFLPEVPWPRLPGASLAYGVPLLVDLMLATALATWLRGAAGSAGRAFVVLATAVLAFAALSLGFALWPGAVPLHQQVLWTRGWGHMACQLLLALVFTLAAQRAWRRADLAPLARAAAAARD